MDICKTKGCLVVRYNRTDDILFLTMQADASFSNYINAMRLSTKAESDRKFLKLWDRKALYGQKNCSDFLSQILGVTHDSTEGL